MPKMPAGWVYNNTQKVNNRRGDIVGVVHDEILLESPNEKAGEMAELLKSTMEEAGNSILKYIPCQADVGVSQNWADI